MTTELTKEPMSLANLDFKEVYAKAVEIFSEQALLNKKPSEVTLRDIELSRAKSNNFLEAISGVLEIGHQVEVLSAEKNKFKRTQELSILQLLLSSCEKQAAFIGKNMDVIQKRIDMMHDNMDDVEPEQLALLQSIMGTNIDASQKVIASMARLIQLERMSGSRPWGTAKAPQTNAILIEPASEDNKQTKKPRKLTPEELASFEND